MNIAMIKIISGLIVSVGVGTIVSNAVKSITPTSTSTIKNIVVGIGGLVLSSMLAVKAVEYTEMKIDDGVDVVRRLATELKEI